ncbi:MAG: SRPBCC domain-containing protein [Reyranella sp.]
MVSLTEKTTIPLPTAEVWPLLNDPALVASCIPGAQLAPDQGDGLWRGSIRVKFGPTVAVFRGEAGLTFDDAARTGTIEGRGMHGRGDLAGVATGFGLRSASVTEPGRFAPLFREHQAANIGTVWDVRIDDLIPSRTYRRVHCGKA